MFARFKTQDLRQFLRMLCESITQYRNFSNLSIHQNVGVLEFLNTVFIYGNIIWQGSHLFEKICSHIIKYFYPYFVCNRFTRQSTKS